ncbi:MAG TPA: rhomboid family intramembrane serine protease [Pyrinomonadaceae bacterium]
MNNANYAGRPSVCRNCGALVGADEASCSACGAQKVSAAAAPQFSAPVSPPPSHDRETIKFARAVLSRPYIFTIVFIAANVFVFLLMWSSSGLNNDAVWQPPTGVLLAYGAKLNFLIDAGQWWRFVTPVFIHIGLPHLLVNMYGLWMIGPYVERLYGSAKFVVLWVGTGVAGVVASYLSVRPGMAVGPLGRFLFTAGDGPSAGASGALFGLIGVLFVFGIKFRRELPEGFKRAFGTGLLPVIVLNLFIGYLGRGFIDNAAHLGGLLSGALFGLVIGYKRPGARAGVAVFWHILQAAALALVAVSFLMVALSFHRPYADAAQSIQPVAGDEAADEFVSALNRGRDAFVTALDKGDAGGVDEAVKALEKSPALDKRSGELLGELKSLLARAKEYAVMPSGGRAEQQRRAHARGELASDFEEWANKRDRWVRTEGDNLHGVYFPPPPREK